MSTIPQNSLITIVGLSGYIASHVGLSALRAGYRVRGTVRSLERGKRLKEAYINLGIQDIDSRLEIVMLDDLNSVEQYLRAFEGVEGVINPALSQDNPLQMETVDLAIQNTLNMLQAAQRVPSLKRVVLTSSIVSALVQGKHRDKVITEDDWDDSPKEFEETLAAGQKPDPMLIYHTAKVKSERVAWEFMSEHKPHFDLVCVLPGSCIGPVLCGVPQSTAGWFAPFFKGDNSSAKIIHLSWHIDIRDCGKIHLESLITASVGGRRVICVSRPFGWNGVLAIMRDKFPEVKTIAPDIETVTGDTWRQMFDNSLAKVLVGEFISVEQSIVDFGKSIGY